MNRRTRARTFNPLRRATVPCAIVLIGVAMQWSGTARSEPSLAEIVAACEYLEPGDIPADTFQPPATAVYVATAADGGSDANSGTTITAPFEHLDKAIEYANANSSTPLTIYLRSGIHSFKGAPFDPYQMITRGNLYVTAYSSETATIRPFYWPGNPTDWGDERAFELNGSFDNITFARLRFEGWSVIFNPGSSLQTPPLRNLTVKDVTATSFTRRNGEPGYERVLFTTGYLSDDVYGPGKIIFDDPDAAHYQVENLILSNITVQGVDLAVNVGDENDANVKGMRITNLRVVNPTREPGASFNDAIAVVNSYRVLIDHCRIVNINDDGIDCKSYDVAVVNCYLEGTGRNAVKFWRNGEMINSILYNVTDINDGAIIAEEGPFRMINSVLLGHPVGYGGTFNGDLLTTLTHKLEIVNSAFGECKAFYINTTDLRAHNNRYFDVLDQANLIEGMLTAADVTALNALPNCSGNAMSTNQFAHPTSGDFSLAAGSAWIDAGTTQGVLLPTFDYLGNPRMVGAGVDIGPIELQSTPTSTATWSRYD